jgi:hypothetical protein
LRQRTEKNGPAKKVGPEDAGCIRPARVPKENQVLPAHTARGRKIFPLPKIYFARQFGSTVCAARFDASQQQRYNFLVVSAL